MAVKYITLPLKRSELVKLKAGDVVSMSGVLVFGRDRAHKYITEGGKVPYDLKDGCIYHCGPIVDKTKDGWKMVAAGPTTSMREELYEEDVMRRTGARVIMGKAGMGPKMQHACKTLKGIYLEAVGGLAQLHAQRIVRVIDVFKLEEFGKPEAMWRCEVKDFPAIVGIDSKGISMYAEVKKKSEKPFKKATK